MRTMILALAVVLLAAPVWATVTITATDEGDGVVAIDFNSVGETELVRAFALDITVDAGVITDVCDFAVGDDNGGYGIFPGNFSRYITVDPGTGNVDDWGVGGYTPVAEDGDPGALGGLGTAGVTIELGSLYETNAPGNTGRLCTLKVTENCNVSLALNALRGNVVMEDAAEPDVVLEGCEVVLDCFPSTYTTYGDWVTLGKPNCWCGIYGTPPWPYQCDADIDNAPYGPYQIYTSDLNIMAANWKKRGTDPTLNACADVNHKPYGPYRVYTDDLGILAVNWKKRATQLPGNCPRPE
jgi:hypothetical protein